MADSDRERSLTATVAWGHRDFRLYSAARFLGVMGSEAQSVGVAWQIYQLTHSALALGYTGLALFLPGLLFTLPAGHIADLYDRRSIILSCYVLQLVATLSLLVLTLHGIRSVWFVYGILFVIGLGRCFSGPAASALVPTLVPREHFVNAVTWGASIFQTANAVGPLVGGLLFTLALTGRIHLLNGAPIVYVFAAVCLLAFLLLVVQVHPRGAADKKGFTLKTMLTGFHYVMGTRLLLGSISLDLFAVLLGGAVSLLPIFAADVLHRGAHVLGLLRAMPALGSLLVSLTLSVFPIRRNAGKTMLFCVGGFGVATVIFGLSHTLWISGLALFFTGATDMVSVIVRSSILQLATPAEMRGRVSSINWLFLGASNEFGEYESGLTAHWFGAVRAVVLGGLGSLAVTGLWSVFFPALRRVNQLTAEDLVAAETALSAAEPVD